VQNTPQGPGDLYCWTHLVDLTRSFTKQEVQDGWAEVECRLNLQDDLEATQIQYLHHGENRRRMRKAKVRLAALEQLVRRILGDQSHPSSTESFGASQSPQPLQDRRTTFHLHYSNPVQSETEVFPRGNGGSYIYTRHRSRRHSRRREEENVRYNQKTSQLQDPGHRSPQNLPQSCYSGNEEGEDSHRQARQSEQRFEHSAGSQQNTLQSRTLDAREPRQVSPSCSPSHERAESRRRRRQSELRYDDNAAPELATAELRDPVARKTRRSHHSNDERPDNYISAPRRSFSTNGDEHLGGNWHVPPILQVASNLQSAHSSQPREDNLELGRTTSEGEQPNFKRKLRQPPNCERDDHQSEQRARHRERSISRREQAMEDESLRPHTPDESNHWLPSNVYHQQLREQGNRDTSRIQLPLSSSKYSTHNATNIYPDIPSKHNLALQENDCLPRTQNFDQDHLARYPTTSRRSPSFSQNTAIPAPTYVHRSTSTHTAFADSGSVPQRSNSNVIRLPMPPRSLEQGQPQGGQHATRRPSSGSAGPRVVLASSISHNSHLASDSSAYRQSNQRAEISSPPPSSLGEDQSWRHKGSPSSRSSSTSEASTGGYDTCFSTSSSLSSHSTLVPEPVERQPPRQDSRYYPPDSYQPLKERRRRRKPSRSRSSSSSRHRD
jgi:hypothetical protein